MKNFGRGMWRRVGDFERINIPQILNSQNQESIKHYLDYLEFQKAIKRREAINKYREQILKDVNSEHISNKEDLVINNNNKQEFEETKMEIIAVEVDIPSDKTSQENNNNNSNINENLVENSNIRSKNLRKKNKKKL